MSGRERSRSVSCSSPTVGGSISLRSTSRAEGLSSGLAAINQRTNLATWQSNTTPQSSSQHPYYLLRSCGPTWLVCAHDAAKMCHLVSACLTHELCHNNLNQTINTVAMQKKKEQQVMLSKLIAPCVSCAMILMSHSFHTSCAWQV